MSPFLGTPIHEVFGEDYAEWASQKLVLAGSLSSWQRATRRLAELLPLGPLSEDSLKFERDDFGDFLFQEPTPSFHVRDGRITWEIGLFMTPTLCPLCCRTFPDIIGALDNPARLREIQSWLLDLPVNSPELWNGLCSVLPLIADADPIFTKLVLDPKTWQHHILAERKIDGEERAKRLRFVEGAWFGHILNNSMLHVFGSLANNHIRVIEDFFDHPYLCGSYTNLFAQYVFAVLFTKVAILRHLSQERHDLWRVNP